MQQVSRARKDINHLHDGPEQEQRDASFADNDPLAQAGWIYSYDVDLAVKEALV